jgi:hypothetical protein
MQTDHDRRVEERGKDRTSLREGGMEGDRSKRRQVQRTEKQVDISSGVEGRRALRMTSRSSKDQ